MALNKISATFQFAKRPQLHTEAASEAAWTPNTDVYLTDAGLVIKVELAGMRREDLELTVEGNRLRICGSRRDACREGRCKFVLMEINYGPFESVIDLPAGYDPSSAKAAYQNGFLRVDVPLSSPVAAQTFSVPIDTDDGF